MKVNNNHIHLHTVDPCKSSPCANGGKCINSGDGFKCECPEHYEGETCQLKGWLIIVIYARGMSIIFTAASLGVLVLLSKCVP